MCKIMGFKPTRGKGRIYHIREFERYCTYRKEGQKFIVEEVFDEPLPKIDGRSNNGENNNKYDDLMDKLIINLLIDYDGYIEESYSSLMNNYFSFFTNEYKKLYNMGYTRYSQVNQMGKGLVMEYQQKMKEVVETCLETALKRLKRNGIIEYEQNTVVLDNKFTKGYADPKMLKKIRDTEKKVYEEMGKTPFDRGNPHINRQFKNKVCDYLQINNYWNVYTFELVDKNTEPVDEDSDELIRRFIKSTEENTKNKKGTYVDSDGNRIKPYSYDKYASSIDRLSKLIWNLPEGYTSEYDFQQLLVENVSGIKNRYKEYEYDCEEDDEQEQVNWGIPF